MDRKTGPYGDAGFRSGKRLERVAGGSARYNINGGPCASIEIDASEVSDRYGDPSRSTEVGDMKWSAAYPNVRLRLLLEGDHEHGVLSRDRRTGYPKP